MATDHEDALHIMAQHLRALSEQINEPLELEEGGICVLETSDGNEYVLRAVAGTTDIVLSSPIPLADTTIEPEHCAALLAMNFDLTAGSDASLCLNPEFTELILQQRLSLVRKDYEEFVSMIDGFFEIRDSVIAQVAEIIDPDDVSADAGDDTQREDFIQV